MSPTAVPPAVDAAVRGLGYELVEMTRVPGGVLRVTIDHPFAPGAGQRFIGVDDCEAVSRQLSHVLEVEGIDYGRLEVSSPGLDRPLKDAGDFARFAGEQVEVTLKAPFRGRKHWRGELRRQGEGDDVWRVVLSPSAPSGPAKRAKRSPSAAGPKGDVQPAGEQALDFTLAEVREARLVPAVDFKGRGRTDAAPDRSVGGPNR